jgi:hypothetical protein
MLRKEIKNRKWIEEEEKNKIKRSKESGEEKRRK